MPSNRRKIRGSSSDGEEFGVFERGGSTVIAYSAEEAVRYRFDGWKESKPAAPQNREPEPTPDAAPEADPSGDATDQPA